MGSPISDGKPDLLGPQKQALLAERLKAARARSSAQKIPRIVRDGAPLRASFEQARLWFLNQLAPESAAFNVPLVLRLVGPIDVLVLERSVQALVARHETLRMTFTAVDGEPRLVIHPPSLHVPLARVEASSESEARTLVAREIHARFDLERGPLFRATLVRVLDDVHLLVLCMHHCVTDGWSLGVLLRDLSALFAALSIGEPDPLPPLGVEYADFAAWQRQWLTGKRLDEQLAFWKEALRGAPPNLELPTDHPRPAFKEHRGGVVRFEVSPPLVERLREYARSEDVTVFMLLVATYAVLLGRWSGQDDVVVGTPVANRMRSELEPLVGMFVNTVPLRASLRGSPSFREVVGRVKEASFAAFAHQNVPFERLVDALAPPRDTSRTAIFQAMFVLLNMPLGAPTLGAATVQAEPAAVDVSEVDVSLSMMEASATIRGLLEYDAALFDRATIERLAEHFQTLLAGALDRPDASVAELALMNADERRRVVTDWNATSTEHDIDVTVADLFAAQARRTPDAVAVEYEQVRLSYGALDERAERVAGWLAGRGVRRGNRVAIAVPRSADMLAAMLGVLKAGAAYVPIDPRFPEDRRSFMREDAGCVAELSPAALAQALASPRRVATPLPARPGDLAYVLYTSGSTGRPKGVMVEHRAVVSFLRSMQRAPGIAATDTLVALTTLSFDIAALELYLPLVAGARVVVATTDVASDPEQLGALLERSGATIMQATPATWRMLVANRWCPPARLKMLCGGEAIGAELATRLTAGGRELWNMYGPTETTIWSTCIKLDAQGPITIGRPIANTSVYVLDRRGEPMPVGLAGELHIGGAGVALGYLGRGALTGEKFVPDPFSSESGARMYATGDRARWRNDGTLEYLNRLDHQVKVRGFRIELGEIEAQLGQAPGVREAVVVAREDGAGDARLVAYVVAASGAQLAVGDLKESLRKTLPDYMIPSAFVVLGALPLTPNGKIDRRALPAPELAVSESTYVAPRSPVERALAQIFSEALRVPGVGVNDDFFALGGHSLMATGIIARVRAALNVTLPVRAVFEGPTVALLAARIEASTDEYGEV